jgi:membrane glycosyltransferase
MYLKHKTLWHIPAKAWRAPLFSVLILATTIWGALMMLDIISANRITALEPIIFILFVISFAWISFAFWSSIIGFLLFISGRDPLTLRRNSPFAAVEKTVIKKRTALIMPIYNEDPSRVMAGMEATLRSLAATGEQQHFDCYLLSDTTKNDIAIVEFSAFQQLQQRVDGLGISVFYRRRTKNHYRKVGNIADFCQRWGSHYNYMIVLDADSIMDGRTLTRMVKAMQSNHKIGLLQTVPTPVRQYTFFGRFLQFAAELHSPLLAMGNSFWQTDTGNYWGHNAIIRVDAFMAHCCLPHLSGHPPFGGEILSHDFVEAALLKRAGWQVFTITDPVGSYEEIPSNIIDYIVRDRRWAQGNLQHLRLLNTKSLHIISRFHFLSGALAYILSLLWLIMLTLGTTDAILQALNSNQFFSNSYQLFPDWHIAKPELVYSLLGSTLMLLFTPKVLSLCSGFLQGSRAFGGFISLLLSATIELLVAVIIAPVMMIFHAYFVAATITGTNVDWKTQSRSGRGVPWNEALKHTLLVTLTAIIWGGLAYLYAPKYFWWLLPVLVGLVLAAPIIRYSGSIWLGQLARRLGIFSVSSETLRIEVIAVIDGYENHYQQAPMAPTQSLNLSNTPEEKWRQMAIQSL